jgi:hypothetical protein
MIRLARLSLIAAAALLVPSAAWGAVTVSKKIDYAASAHVVAKVRSECNLQTAIPAAIENNSKDVQLVDGPGTLSLKISDIQAVGGGVASGPKWVEVKGTYKGKSFRAKRISGFDPFAGGTCGILAKIARALGADIALWLENPTNNAELGDAR